MSKAIAKTVRYSLVVVGLVIVALLVAPFFIDVNVYKKQIEQTVEDSTGRKLSIGNMNASLFPWVGVELDNVHLANRKGFAERDFLSVERLHVKLALLPLLSKNIEIKHFEVVTPVAYLERHSNGETNWGDLVSSQPATDASEASSDITDAPAAPALAALQAESITLTGGDVTWVDGEAAPVVLSELNVALNDVQLERPVAVKVSGKLSGNAFDVDANVGPLGDITKLDPVSLPVQGHVKADNISLQPFAGMITGWPEMLGDINKAAVGLSARIEQRPGGLRLGEGELHLNAAHTVGLNWQVEMPDTNQLKINRAALNMDGKSLMDASGKVQNLTANPTFSLRIDGQPIARTWLAAFVPDLNAMYANHPSPWQQIQLHAVLAGGTKQMDIRDLQLMLDGELLQASGALVYNGPDIRLRMAAKQMHLDPWLPQGKQEQKSSAQLESGFSLIREAVAAADASAEPDLRFLKSWIVTSRLNVGSLFVRGLEMSNFAASINGANGRFDLSPLSFNLAGGKVTEKASINAASYPANWKESVHITGVQAGPLLTALANVDMLEGTMAMDTSLRGNGLTPDAAGSLNGRGNFMFSNGTIKKSRVTGILRGICNSPNLRQLVLSGRFAQLLNYKAEDLDFSQLSGSFNVTNGLASNQDLFMASPFLRMAGKGSVHLVTKQLNYRVEPRVVGSCRGQGDGTDRTGLMLPVNIGGTMDAPVYKPEWKALVKFFAAKLGGGGGGVKGVLGGILGGGNQAPAEKPGAQINPQPQQDTQPESPQKKILKGLGGMVPGF